MMRLIAYAVIQADHRDLHTPRVASPLKLADQRRWQIDVSLLQSPIESASSFSFAASFLAVAPVSSTGVSIAQVTRKHVNRFLFDPHPNLPLFKFKDLVFLHVPVSVFIAHNTSGTPAKVKFSG